MSSDQTLSSEKNDIIKNFFNSSGVELVGTNSIISEPTAWGWLCYNDLKDQFWKCVTESKPLRKRMPAVLICIEKWRNYFSVNNNNCGGRKQTHNKHLY